MVPILGKSVPFHIVTIKNISKQDEGRIISLRLNFHTPATYATNQILIFPETKPEYMYIRDLTFRSSDRHQLTNVYRTIKALQKDYKAMYQETKNMTSRVKQERV